MRFMMLLIVLAVSERMDILDLTGARLGAGVPPGWKVRAVRGQRAPEIEVRNDGDGPVLRVHGAGRAAWFYRELSPELAESGGALRWSWRVLDAPAVADMRTEKLDDSPIRVYVVFGKPGIFRNSARIIFYTFGNAEPSGYARASFVSDKLYVIRVDGVAERTRWHEHTVDPFADYRRVWKRKPPAITAVGVMQDTDQTRARATAEIRQLEWIPPGLVERSGHLKP
ncbi:MAG TPA: DUF3047 domain-containing protein [Gemmatimonadaceae bacterium]|nr:DUF3047 domain-containing protein [Gemmatimonadaceae bacterium]